MYTTEIMLTILSLMLGVDLKSFKKSLDKTRLKDSDNLKISESIDAVTSKLEDSKEIIENALLEMEEQKKLFEQAKKEAEISQQISSMNQEQVAALNKLLENTLNRQEKKAFPKNFGWNLFFCILSAVLGFLLGKFL